MNKLRELNGGNFAPIAPQQPNKQELTGAIVSKERKIVYKKNEFNGNTYFRLKVLESNKEKPTVLFVYPNIVSKQIFNDIANSNYIYKQYLFACERIKLGWILNDWEEVENYEKK